MEINDYAYRQLRKKAYAINLQIVKGFQHCRNAVIYDDNGNRQSGYMIKDLEIGFFLGGYDENFDFLMDLDEVIEFLKGRYLALGLDW